MKYPFLLFSVSMLVSMCGGLTSPAVADESLPRWEAGVAVGVASLPQYMGSDERYTIALPLPFVIYRGDRVNLDRNGLRADLFGNNGLSVDASLSAGLPVRNTNRARAGMPALHFSLQAGPRINWRVYENEAGEWTLRLPWRGVMDVKGNYLGWVSEPDVKVQLHPAEDVSLRLFAGALLASRKYNASYYSVDPIYATGKRPAYQARGGLHSLSVGGAVFWTINNRLRLFSSVRYRNLSSGVVADSPLVKTPHYLSGVVGLAWSFYQSDERAVADLTDD
ncbi:MAG TPA: MipA/OmpV family protein [Mariprofundaceae bacterium]|nr:MipA/OmpV family protein [Mariprofundaceae bacterium]